MKAFARSTMTLKTSAAIALLVTFCGFYMLSVFYLPGWLSFSFSTVALVFILLTAIARVNDISEDSIRWHLRRIGLIAVAGGCVAVLLQTFLSQDFPTWNEVLIRWGFAVTWATTPNMPPWWIFMGQQDQRAVRRDAEPPL